MHAHKVLAVLLGWNVLILPLCCGTPLPPLLNQTPDPNLDPNLDPDPVSVSQTKPIPISCSNRILE